MNMKKNNLTEGPIFKSLLLFSLPMIVTNSINLVFHATDVAILAAFADGPAVAAVGACGTLITLMVSLFTGLATGSNVLIAKRIGAKDEEGTRRAVGTSLTIGLLSGIFLLIVAQLFARTFLKLMDCPDDLLDMSTLYMRIYFFGSPILMLNSFAMATLRSSGDSVRPMIYSILSGATNLLGNIVFVAIFDMTVSGVAISTVLASLLSLVLTLIRLARNRGLCQVKVNQLRLRKIELFEIARVGLPTCLCSLSFYAANVSLASAVNSLGTKYVTANSISGQFDGFIYTVGAAIAAATSVMVAQNYGAKRFDRIHKTIRASFAYGTTVSLFLGTIFVIFSRPLLGILSDDAEVISIAQDRMTLLCLTYFITTHMEIFASSLRALKRQKWTMVVGFICGFCIRILWRYLIWPLSPSLPFLFSCFYVSAFVAVIIYLFVYIHAMKKFASENTIPA